MCVLLSFLKSLPKEDYGPVVTTLTNLSSPKLVDIVGSLMEEAKKLKKQWLIYSQAYFTNKTAKGNTSKNHSKNLSKDKFKCNFCGKLGHFEKDYFIKKKMSANIIHDNDEEEPMTAQAFTWDEANVIDAQDLAI